MLPHGFPPVFSFTAVDGGLPASETTIGEVAKAAGYRTAYLGTYWLTDLLTYSSLDSGSNKKQ